MVHYVFQVVTFEYNNHKHQHVFLPFRIHKKSHIIYPDYILDLPPTQDASHHQDDITFLGSGIPT